MIRASGPRLPTLSRNCTVTTVSPAAKPNRRAIWPQYCVVDARFTKRGTPSENTVQASADPRDPGTPSPVRNRHPKSLRRSEIVCVTSKLGGFTAGTPPITGSELSHTSGLPLPSGWVT